MNFKAYPIPAQLLQAIDTCENRVNQKVGVLEKAQAADIENCSCDEKLLARLRELIDGKTEEIVRDG